MFTIHNVTNNFPPLVPFTLNAASLSVLTGVNGTGKTRLLQQIANGNIQVTNADGKKIEPAWIQFVGSASGLAAVQGEEPQDYKLEKLAQITGFEIGRLREAQNNLLQKKAGQTQFGQLTEQKRNEIHKSLYKDVQEWILLSDEERKNSREVRFNNNFFSLLNSAITSIRAGGMELPDQDLPYLAVGHALPDIERKFGFALQTPISIKLLSLFEKWRRLYAENEYAGYARGRGADVVHLTEDEFERAYGPAPWRALNKILSDIGSELRFEIPEGCENFQEKVLKELNLRDRKGHVFQASGISSGERIIFLIALSRYLGQTDIVHYRKPKLMLFDEPDAHLHPSLAGQMMKMLEDQFISQGICVLMTTHSATTVAQADDGAILTLGAHQPLKSSTRHVAIQLLLSGQEKLFLDLSGTKVIFVEDQSDVVRIEALIKAIDFKPQGYPLLFKSLSRRIQQGSAGGGKAGVKKLLQELGENRNVFGLIDYDGRESVGCGVHTLCGSERYGMENLLLDPRLLLYVLLRHNTESYARCFGLELYRLEDLDSLDADVIQGALDKLHSDLGFNRQETVAVSYEDGQTFNVSSEWLMCACHDLERKVEEKYKLSSKSGGDDALTWIAKQVVSNKSGYLPISFRETLNKL